MSDQISLEGKEYISSKRASQISDYAQDYIGQLARAGLIEAKRIGGLWYVSLESLNAYKTRADEYTPEPPKYEYNGAEQESVISLDGKQYVSAARAAKTTGYHQDYVGQLARSGKILSRQIGNRWYVDHGAIVAHKEQKDALLGAVQAEAVGVHGRGTSIGAAKASYEEPFYTYTPDQSDLMPPLRDFETEEDNYGRSPNVAQYDPYENRIPIHVFGAGGVQKEQIYRPNRVGRPYAIISASVLGVFLLLGIGFVTLRSNALGVFTKQISQKAHILEPLTASAANSARGLSEWIERFLIREISYTRSK